MSVSVSVCLSVRCKSVSHANKTKQNNSSTHNTTGGGRLTREIQTDRQTERHWLVASNALPAVWVISVSRGKGWGGGGGGGGR